MTENPKEKMKRVSESTAAPYRSNPDLNSDAADRQTTAAANAQQAANAPAPVAIFNMAPEAMAERLLPLALPAIEPVNALLAASMPTWSVEIPARAGQPVLTVRQRAEMGDADAQHEMGEMKHPRTPASFAQARTWLEKAAAQNHGDAECALGLLYEQGEGVPVSLERAAQWYLRSAGHGSAPGQRYLGEAYLNGAGIGQNDAEAFKWFTKAEEQKDLPSRTFLGYLYYKGIGVEQNLEKTMKFICATNYDDEKSIMIDGQLGQDYMGKAYPEDVNVLLPYLFNAAELNKRAKDIVFDGLEVNDQGAVAIATTLRNNTSVERLFLADGEIGEEGASAIIEAVHTTVTPLKKIQVDEHPGFSREQIDAINQRLRQNPQIFALMNQYLQDEIRFESSIELPPEIAQKLVHELILNDQTRRYPVADGPLYATREETAKRVEELLYVIGCANAAL